MIHRCIRCGEQRHESEVEAIEWKCRVQECLRVKTKEEILRDNIRWYEERLAEVERDLARIRDKLVLLRAELEKPA